MSECVRSINKTPNKRASGAEETSFIHLIKHAVFAV